jgi:hypothetical protein
MLARPTWSAAPLLVVLAACTPGDRPSVAVSVDTVAVVAALDSLRGEYMRRYAAGDAAGMAAMYSEAGGIDFYGAPPMRGRAGIEAGLATGFAVQKPVLLQIVAQMTLPIGDSRVAERGTYHTMDSLNGKGFHSWGRWISSGAKDSSGAWRLNYLMAFPDSQKTD